MVSSGFWTEKDWSEKGLAAEMSSAEAAEQHLLYLFLGKAIKYIHSSFPTNSEIDTVCFSYTIHGLSEKPSNLGVGKSKCQTTHYAADNLGVDLQLS